MWIPRAYLEEDRASLHDLMETFSFAALVSAAGGDLFGTHLPFMLDRDRGRYGTLIAHMARSNPHWKSLEGEVLVIFQGPHSYVSPAWYRDQVTVPTWNYAIVHAYGRPELIHEPERLRPMVERLVKLHEGAGPGSWRLEQAEPVMEAELKGIVGFEIEITRLEGKFKLNQNRRREDQEGVVEALGESADSLQQGVCRMMRRNLDESEP